ncbi:MAG: ATP-binding protein [Candidatus Thermoplasmatota archaeon]|nr:ATP-binding protein [Candidatus Thermoplasmatota archaeon]
MARGKTRSVELQISDKNMALTLLGNIYDPREAVAQLVANSIDENAECVWVIRAKRGRSNTLKIIDDGDGVFPDERGYPNLEYLAENVCRSKKRITGEISKKGEYGIGLLGFQTFGKTLILTTKRADSPTCRLTLQKDDISNASIEEDVHPPLSKPHGTEALIKNVHKGASRILTGAKIADYLKQKFRSDIRSEKVSIMVEDNGHIEDMTIEEYKGVPFPMINLPVKDGRIKLNLYVVDQDYAGERKVAVVRKGATVYENITQLSEFDCPPWNTGGVVGEIVFDECKVDAAKLGFDRSDPLFDEFTEKVSSISKDLSDLIEDEERKREQIVTKEMMTKLRRAFSKALEELPHFSPFDVARKRGTGKPAPSGEAGEVITKVEERDEEREEKEEKEESPKDEKVKRKRRRSLSRGFPPPSFESHPNSPKRSWYDSTFMNIVINSAHSDYRRESASTRRSLHYVSSLYAKEFTVFNFGSQNLDSTELLERMLELQLRVKEYLRI